MSDLFRMVALALALGVMWACDTGGKTIGEQCSDDGDCASGECSAHAVCTKSCHQHEDCGCPPGTTNGDIDAGRCKVGCSGDLNKCVTFCEVTSDCKGDALCEPFTKECR